MKMKCLKMIVVSMTAAAVCMALTGCDENTKTIDSQGEASSDTMDASESVITETSGNANAAEQESVTEEINTDTQSMFQTELKNQGLFDYEMLLNGEVIGVPIAESELLARGWTLESSDDEASEFEKNRCTLRLWDFEEKDGDRIAYSIMFSDNILKGNYSCSCVNEISLIDSTKDDVIAAFGEPHEILPVHLASAMIYYESPSTAMEEKDKVKRTNGCNNITFKVNDKGVMFEVLMKRPEDMPQ